MQHLHNMPQFLLAILFTQLSPVLLHGPTKISIPIENLGTNITSWKVSCGSKSRISVESCTLSEPVSIKSFEDMRAFILLKLFCYLPQNIVWCWQKKEVCIYRRKKSTHNQIAEYNQNNEITKVKDLQRKAISELKIGCSIKECVTKRLWYILVVFVCA